MAINVNSPYKKVLSIMNKEQRGYMTPSEFGEIGTIVQLNLLDKAIYDLNKQINYKSRGAVNEGVSDTVVSVREKLDAFYKNDSIIFSGGSANLPSDVYKIINVTSSDRMTIYEKIKKHEMSYMLSSPLTAPTSKFPTYYDNATGLSIGTFPVLADNVQLLVDYVKKPANPRWGYSKNTTYGTNAYDSNVFVAGGVAIKPGLTNSITSATTTLADGVHTDVTTTSSTGSGLTLTLTVALNTITAITVQNPGSGYSVGDTVSITDGGQVTLSANNLYSSSTYGSTDFELHPSEEPSLVNGILAYAGVIVRDPNITQLASQIIQSNEATKQ